jgi:hypothetical protein
MKTEMTTNINLIVKNILKLIILLKIFILLEKFILLSIFKIKMRIELLKREFK